EATISSSALIHSLKSKRRNGPEIETVGRDQMKVNQHFSAQEGRARRSATVEGNDVIQPS
ncbi:MAG TPA: hypothetical protein VN857_07320, partial [Chthoniobacterales bacterium]|nr:hypothetical protein [Chthoniobacterales bacterium]